MSQTAETVLNYEEGTEVVNSNFTQANRAQLVEARKREFTILAADGNTVGSVRSSDGSVKRLTYTSKSHARALDAWVGMPVIINHGDGKLEVVGEVTGSDISEAGLLLSFRIDNDRMLQIIERDAYEGFSIGTGVHSNDPLSVVDDKILSYHPVELSVIMMPHKPACPKGVCDIISMITSSCDHSGDESVEQTEINEVVSMGKEGEAHENCSCGGKEVINNIISFDPEKHMNKSEFDVAMSAKDETISELKDEINTVKSSLEEEVESLKKELAEYHEKDRQAALSSLPAKVQEKYQDADMAEVMRLVSFYEDIKAEDAGARETNVESSETPEETKPWVRGEYKPGEY